MEAYHCDSMNIYNPFSLSNKTILITGASSGIGAATAIECSRMGASVIITGRNEERLNETFSRLDISFGQLHQQIIADLSKSEDVLRMIEQIGKLDGLVNNAGVNRVKPVAFLKKDDFDSVFQTNVFSQACLVQQLIKKKKIQKGASIVFTSSVSTFYNAPGRSLYASSKSALTSFMRSCAVELADKNIRANAVHPGMVETKMILENLTDEERQKDMNDYPLKRYGKPEEISWAIIYLLSDASAWVTGSSLTIDSGFMLK